MTRGRKERIGVYRELQHRFRPDRRQFEQLVQNAISELPLEFRQRLHNVAVTVAEFPPSGTGTSEEELFGLYEGIALPDRSDGAHLVAPDRITIYRQPILAACRTREEACREIRDTVVHEIGHYFGLGELELP
ncbi:MAG: metallopeptidase family protein [Chloroflexota bacterium]